MARLSGAATSALLAWVVLSMVMGFAGPVEAGTKIAAEDIRNALSEQVEKNHPWPLGSVRCTILSRVSDILFPQEAVTFEVANDPAEDFIGDTQLSVKYYTGRNLVREEMVRVSVEVLMDVVVSTRELARNREITDDDVSVQKKWLKKSPTNVVTAVSDIIGKTLAYHVKPNSEILKNSLRSHLLIRRGNVVRILFDNDLFTISALGISEEDGARDKMIKVKNLSSNKIIYARVTGNGLVKVEF